MAAAAMDDMAARFADRAVRSIFIYTREAHPGENYPHHQSMDDKRATARAFQSKCNVQREIYLDDLSGTAHRGYGLLPNMTWIIGRGGLVLYKAAWTAPDDIEVALNRSMDGMARRAKDKLNGFYTEQLAWRVDDREAFRRGLEVAGPKAVEEFFSKWPRKPGSII